MTCHVAAGCEYRTASFTFSFTGQLPVPMTLNARNPTLLYSFLTKVTIAEIIVAGNSKIIYGHGKPMKEGYGSG